MNHMPYLFRTNIPFRAVKLSGDAVGRDDIGYFMFFYSSQ